MESGLVTIPATCLALDRQTVAGLPPSALKVYKAVLDHGPVTLPRLQAETELPRRTVAFAIATLKRREFIAWHQRLDDYRVRYFSVHPRLVHPDNDGCSEARKDGAIIRVLRDTMAPSDALGLGPG